MIHELVQELGEHRGDCPVCGGTSTFTVTSKEGYLIYNCYKAGCNTKGRIKHDYSKKDIINYYKPTFNGVLSLTECLSNMSLLPPYLNNSFVNSEAYKAVINGRVRMLYDTKKDRLVLISKDGVVVGRYLGVDKNVPKWYNYRKNGKPFIVRSE